MMKQINDTRNRKHSAEKSVNALFQDKTSSSNSQIVHFGSIKRPICFLIISNGMPKAMCSMVSSHPFLLNDIMW